MSDEEVRLWLVERSYGSDEDLVTLVYATRDGTRHLKQQLSHNMLYGKTITAARIEHPDDVDPVRDDDLQDRYASEASRMAERHAPGDEV